MNRLTALLTTGLLAGCSVSAMTGDMMSSYAVEHLEPYLLSTSDLAMACETGVSMGAYLMSFGRVTDPPDQAAIGTLATAANCAEVQGWAAELRRLRALNRGDAPGAQDARITEKRAHALASDRYFRAYKHLVRRFGEPGGECPDLDDANAQRSWLLGMLAGAQAVQHDRAAGGVVGVPLDVPRKAARGVRCLNNERWWGVPEALEAAIWTGIPGAGPEGVDPWAQLDRAASLGAAKGVRLAQAIAAKAAAAAGKEDRVRALIKAHVAALAQTPAAPKWALLDRMATQQIRALSDRLWTRATGHRTPSGALGTFWDDEGEDEDDDGLLDGLEPEAAPLTTPATEEPQ